jgi:hypothetical protein
VLTEHTIARFGQKKPHNHQYNNSGSLLKNFTLKNQAENLQTNLHQKLLPRLLSQRVNIEKSNFWAKSKSIIQNFVAILPSGLWLSDLTNKKSKISHACVPFILGF